MVLLADLLEVLDRLAPAHLAQPGDNSGLQIGDTRAAVRGVLVALELTEPVLHEAVTGGFDTVLTHHPLLYAPVRSLVESRPREGLLRRAVRANVNVVACHTNLDAAAGGLADIAGQALDLLDLSPLEPAQAGWYKLVGFVPEQAVERVAAAVFAAGAGVIGDYTECAFAGEGKGWFTPGPGTQPAVGLPDRTERTPEIRWETVVPRSRLGVAVRAFVAAHPYEEPALDIYAVEDVLPRVGLGRVGTLPEPMTVKELARRVAERFDVKGVSWSGDGSSVVRQVAVLPGSGRSLLEAAAGRSEALITGDVGYHDAERATENGVALVVVPHGDFEWWAMKRWAQVLAVELQEGGVGVAISQEWRPPWDHLAGDCCGDEGQAAMPRADSATPERRAVRMWIDGGSRGNPGPSAVGVVIEDLGGEVVEAIARVIGITTNNVAEYRALLTGLEAARALGAKEVEVMSDSELLVRQMLGEYKVKNEGLKPLHAEARQRAQGFSRFHIRHVDREKNARADALVNRALDE